MPHAIAAGDQVSLAITAVTNPPAGTDAISLSTSADTDPVTLSDPITTAKAVESASLSPGSTAAGASGVTDTIQFTVSDAGALVGGEGAITLVGSSGVDFGAASTVSVTDLTDPSANGDVGSGVTIDGGAIASYIVPNTIEPGDVIDLSIAGLTNPDEPGTEEIDVVTSSSSVLIATETTLVPGTEVMGQITAGSAPAPGALLQACDTSTGNCDQLTADGNGDFSAVLGDGEYEFTASPPSSGSDYGETSDGPLAITGGTPQTVNIALTAPTPLPSGVSLTSNDFGTETNEVPTVNWGDQSTISLKGCPYGAGWASVTGTNTQTGAMDVNFVPLVESSPGSGQYSASLPPLYPVHGSATLNYSITCVPLTYVVPFSGPTDGGTTTTIYGSGFDGTTGVLFGGVPAPSFQVLSDSEISATVPAGSGDVSVTVKKGSGSSDSVGSFEYLSVSSVSPSTGSSAGGGTVTIDGTGFASAVAVTFGGTIAPSFTVDSDSKITATVPPGSGSANVSVITTGGASVSTAATTYTYTGSDAVSRAQTADHTDAPSLLSQPARSSAAAVAIGQPKLDLPIQEGTSPATIAEFIQAGVDAIQATAAQINTADSIQSNNNQTVSGAAGSAQSLVQNSASVGLDMLQGPATHLTVDALVDGGTQAVGGVPLALTELSISELRALMELDEALEKLDQAKEKYQQTLEQAAQQMDQAAAARGQVWDPNTGTYVPCDDSCGDGGDEGGGGSLYVDPSGTVSDTNGNPVRAASAQLLRLSSPGGSFSAPPSGSPIMLPSVNPEKTNSNGQFHWDVYPGDYEVQASKSGCTNPRDADSSVVTSSVFQVPPPKLGISLVLKCRDEAPPPRPSVSSLSRSEGAAAGGNEVTIAGSGFSPRSTVSFGKAKARKTTYLSPDTVAVAAPSGSGTVAVTVSTGTKTSKESNEDLYTYQNPPVISKVSPASGLNKGGVEVAITGANLGGVTSVDFGPSPAEGFAVLSNDKILAVAPAGEGQVHIVVASPGGTSAPTSGLYRYYPPLVTKIAPSSGTVAGGTTVTITGSGFFAPASVAFGSLAATHVVVVSGTEIKVVVPRASSPAVVNVRVTISGETSPLSKADEFTYRT